MDSRGVAMKKRMLNLFLCIFLLGGLLGACVPRSEARMGALAARVVAGLPEEWPEEDLDQSSIQTRPDPDQLAATQVLQIGISSFSGVDPIRTDWSSLYISSTLYIGLTRQEPLSKEFLPALAEKWSVSDDKLTWTFILRPEIAWVFYSPDNKQVTQVVAEDGKPVFVTAEDVRTNILRILDGENEVENVALILYIKNARQYNSSGDNREEVGVKALDERTLQISLDKAIPALDAIAELPFMAAYPSWLDPDGTYQEMEPYYYGYGPYVLRDYDLDNSTVVIKNPFWRALEAVPEGILEQIIFYHYTSETTIEVFKNNKVDLVRTNQAGYEKAIEDPLLKNSVRLEDGLCACYLVFKNIDQGPFSDINNRLAIAHSIDKQGIVENIYQGTAQVLNQFAPPFLRGADYKKPFAGISYNTEQALTKLDAGVWPEDGSEVTFFRTTTTFFNSISDQVIADVESALGRELDPKEPKDEEYYDWVLESENTGLLMYNLCLDYTDAHYFWYFWETGSNLENLLEVDEQGKSDAYLLSLVNQANTTSERTDIYRQLDEALIEEQALAIPLIRPNNIWLVRYNVQGELLPYFQHFENWWISKR
jgi:oligopeptide transport system substrate-binding protein